MASWAEIDENNIVLRVTVGDNNHIDEGYQWLIDNLGGTWLKCSYNTRGGKHLNDKTPYRLNYPGPGWMYKEDLDGFIPPQPHLSWTLNATTGLWDSPSPYPNDDKQYVWNENLLSWTEIE